MTQGLINKRAAWSVLGVAVATAVAFAFFAPAAPSSGAGTNVAQSDAKGGTAVVPNAPGVGDKVQGKRAPATSPDRPRVVRPPEQRPISPAEWAEITDFMGQYMPFRIDEVRRMPEGPLKERVKRLLATRYRGLRLIENRDPEAYDQRLGQLKVEDQVYKLVSEWSAAPSVERQKIRDELRKLVERLVDVDIQERQRRVARLEDELKRQQKMLDQDVRDRDAVIDRRLGRFLDWGNRWPSRRQAEAPDGEGKDGAKGPAKGGKAPDNSEP